MITREKGLQIKLLHGSLGKFHSDKLNYLEYFAIVVVAAVSAVAAVAAISARRCQHCVNFLGGQRAKQLPEQLQGHRSRCCSLFVIVTILSAQKYSVLVR